MNPLLRAVRIPFTRLQNCAGSKCTRQNLSLSGLALAIGGRERRVEGKCDSSTFSRDILAQIPAEVFKRDIIQTKQTQIFPFRFIKFVWDIIRTCLRFLNLAFLFMPVICTYPLTYVSKKVNSQWLIVLLWTLERAGPTFIKLGQWVSTRRDLFSAELCDLFCKLHNHTSVHSWYMTKKKLRKAFGKRWRLLFEKFEKEPIGSGCVGQVHRAYMCSDMIPDESILNDVLSVDESDEPQIDFAQGTLTLYSKITKCYA